MGIFDWIFGADDSEESQLEDMILMDMDEEQPCRRYEYTDYLKHVNKESKHYK